MKIIFMGTPSFAIYALEALIKENKHEIVAVYTRPPKPKSRGQKEICSEIHVFANKHNLTVKTPISLKSEEIQNEIRNFNVDVIIVAAYGMIIPKAILDIPKYGCINIHPSLLPRWRGAAPIQRTLLAGDKETGVCIMNMDEGLDTGPIFTLEKVEINDENFSELHDKLGLIGANLLLKVLDNLENINPYSQDEIGITYAHKIEKHETHIDLNQNIEQIKNAIKAFNGIYFNYDNERFKIHDAIIELMDHSYIIGNIIDSKFTIACNGGLLKPIIIQRAGRNKMNIKDLLRGFQVSIGLSIS